MWPEVHTSQEQEHSEEHTHRLDALAHDADIVAVDFHVRKVPVDDLLAQSAACGNAHIHYVPKRLKPLPQLVSRNALGQIGDV